MSCHGQIKLCCPKKATAAVIPYWYCQELMSAAKECDGASILGMVWASRFVNHTQNKPPYKEGVSPQLVVW